MATIKLRSTKIASKLITYCEKRAVERDGVECEPSIAKEQFKATREIFEKPGGIQAHHIIQSFKPGEIDAAKANEIGRQLAQQIAPGHEAVIYTHTDKEHIHNHIVVNAVSFEDGRKYHSDRAQLFAVREHSDEICKARDLSIIKEPFAKERFSMAEYKLVERGERLWKDELRTAIEKAIEHTSSLIELQTHLKEQYQVEMKIQNKNVSYLHPEKQKYVRGAKLGQAYTKEAIEHEYGRQREGRSGTADRHQEEQRAHGNKGLDPILFGGTRSHQGASNHERSENEHTEQQLYKITRENNPKLEALSRDHNESGSSTHRNTARDERYQEDNRKLSEQSERTTEEGRSGRGEPRTQNTDKLRGSGQKNETNVQGMAFHRGSNRGQQPDVRPSVHTPPAPSGVQKSVLDVLAEAGKAIQREAANQERQAQQQRQRDLGRMAKYQQYDRDRER